MKYRAEIDGLRALAVVPVILFHAGFDLFSGGFVGVDVFFVISGYLITTILVEDIENNRFSIANFYERRARRILPALFFVMLVCIPFAWLWMLPRDLLDFSQSLIAVLLFSSNILFWKESDYFATEAELKPLLHTWSLAVEEQFYLLFPIFLVLAWRFGRSRVFWSIVTIAAISLLVSEWGWRNKPTETFYLAPTRAWELFSGSIAAFIVHRRGVRNNELLALLGLLAIIFAIFTYDETIPFPSVYALLPVIGVVLLIVYAGSHTLAAKVLSTKAFVGIGLISYSAYLWHQPMLALFNYKFEHSFISLAAIVLVTFLLSYLTWKYIEAPFRGRQLVSVNKLLMCSILAYIFIGSVGVFGSLNLGGVLTLSRSDPYFGVYESKRVKDSNQYAKENANNIVIWGDSFADALVFPLSEILKQSGLGLVSYVKHSCPSLINTIRNEPKRLGDEFAASCQQFNQQTINSLAERHKNTHIVITSSYYWYSGGNNIDDEPILINSDGERGGLELVVSSLVATVHWAEQNQLIPIVVLTPPRFDNFEDLLRRNSAAAKNAVVSAAKFRELNLKLRDALGSTSAAIIDPIAIFCQPESSMCDAYDFRQERFVVWYDGDHLSEYGGRVIGEQILDILVGTQ